MASQRVQVSRLAAIALALLTALLLAGCTEPIERSCPRTGILGDAAQTVRHRPGATPGPDSLIARGAIVDLRADCDYDNDEVAVDLDIVIEAARGPGELGEGADLRYFVAILDPTERIVAKRSFRLRIDFPQGTRAGTITEALRQTIPVRDAFTSAAGYRILVGFEPEG